MDKVTTTFPLYDVTNNKTVLQKYRITDNGKYISHSECYLYIIHRFKKEDRPKMYTVETRQED